MKKLAYKIFAIIKPMVVCIDKKDACQYKLKHPDATDYNIFLVSQITEGILVTFTPLYSPLTLKMGGT